MADIVFENEKFTLVLHEDGIPVSLTDRESGYEMLSEGLRLPLFSVTKERPYNNELKLAYMNKKTAYGATRVEKNGDLLTVTFGKMPFKAIVRVRVEPLYMAFSLERIEAEEESYPMPMDHPPVLSFRLLQLAVDRCHPFGTWLNVLHTDMADLCLMASCPEVIADSEELGQYRIMSADVRRELGLYKGAAVLAVGGKEGFLDQIDRVERDYSMPLGVSSRRSEYINSSIYWVDDMTPVNVDEHIKYAKEGGFRLMLLYYTCLFREEGGWMYNGNYEYREEYPEGERSLFEMLTKIRAAGIVPGIHFLHTHIGTKSKYVTPVADPRLNIKKQFTLSQAVGKDDMVLPVYENTVDAPRRDGCRLVRFGGEIISYEGCTEEPPYQLLGCKRGVFGTNITAHPYGERGGVLDVSEYGGTSIYLDQHSDLQDEVGEKLAAAYRQGFGFIYMDGSEGVNSPFEYHVPAAQYRVYRLFTPEPLFGEGAAKAHFGWHMLSGANAFDVFPTEVFKEMIIEHPFREAEMMQRDYSRVNFGWWAFREDTRVDIYEFGTSKAAAYDCPATVMAKLRVFDANPRTSDILGMMRMWEEKRRVGLTDREREMLRREDCEHTIFYNERGELEIAEYNECPVGEETCGVRAFTFTLRDKAWCVLWDDLGESRLSLDAGDCRLYDRPFGEEIPTTVCKNGTSFALSNRVYLNTDIGIDALRAALSSARVERRK